MEEKTRAVLYARYSTDTQTETSIDAQRRAIYEYAQKNNMIIVSEYIDRAKTGTKLVGRDNMNQMIADSKSGYFDVVLVHKSDRFARNLRDTLNLEYELKLNNVKLISTDTHFDDTPEGHLASNVNAAVSQFYSENLSTEVIKGFKESAYKGIHTGGIAPLGYDVDKVNRKLFIIEEEAQAVRMIFELHNKGVSLTQISKALNERGFTTKLGNKFGKNSLHEIIRNKKYCGYYVYNRRTGAQCGKINSHKNKDKDEIVEAEGKVPPIISEEVFNKAQELMNNRKIKAGAYSAKRVYLLSGKVVCGHCGCNMTGNAKYNSKGTLTVTYSCENRRKDKTCPNLNIRRDKLDGLVVDKIAEYIFKAENIPKLTEKLRQLDLERNAEYTNTIKRIEKRIESNNIKRKRIIRAIENDYEETDFKERLAELRKENAELEKSLTEVKEAALNQEITEVSVAALQEKFKRYMMSHGIGGSRILIDKFVESVTENNNQIEIVLNI